jgi:hypothetical protein
MNIRSPQPAWRPSAPEDPALFRRCPRGQLTVGWMRCVVVLVRILEFVFKAAPRCPTLYVGAGVDFPERPLSYTHPAGFTG